MSADNFETAMERLKKIVEDLETGGLPLEESLKKFKEGVKLSNLCLHKLDEAEKQIEMLVKTESGKLISKPFESESES